MASTAVQEANPLVKSWLAALLCAEKSGGSVGQPSLYYNKDSPVGPSLKNNKISSSGLSAND
jgi:hypothetical protein